MQYRFAVHFGTLSMLNNHDIMGLQNSDCDWNLIDETSAQIGAKWG